MTAENEIDQTVRNLLGEFVVIRFALVREGDDDLRTLRSQTGNQLLRGGRDGLVDQIRWQRVDGVEPLALDEADETDFDSVGGREDDGLLCVAQRDILAQLGVCKGVLA
jgi:hypothetical protein